MMFTLATLFTLTVLLSPVSKAANILVIHPLYSGSHEVQLRGLSEVLVSRGHRVTYVKFKNFMNIANKNPNVTLISLAVDNRDGTYPYITKEAEGQFNMPLEVMWNDGLFATKIPKEAFLSMYALCETLLSNKRLLMDLKSQSLDIAIVDIFSNECGLAFVNQLQIPSIAYWALPLNSGEIDYTAMSLFPSYVPAFMSQLTDRMNYPQRVKNYFYKLMGHVVMQIQFFVTNSIIQKYYPGSPHPSQLLANLSAILENSDLALDYPRQLPPNVLNVGCMQCRQPKPLPKEFEDFMQGAGKHGVVLFSMGATFDASVVPRRLLRRLMDAFSRLEQRVLMKFDGSLTGVPDNVRIVKWLPQQDILGHPKTKLFFSHCGMHSIMETVYHGVPVVGMPVYGDQADVVEMIKTRGLGIRLEKDASAEDIYGAIIEVLTNYSYQENARKYKALIRDQPQHPMDRAVWFIEYVMRHHGAEHLKLGSRHLNVFQLYGLDVIPVLMLGAALLLYAIYRCLFLLLTILNTAVKRTWRIITPTVVPSGSDIWKELVELTPEDFHILKKEL